MPTVSLNGAELYYEDRGSGPRVLFIHGMCGNANVWDGQVDRLANRLRCVTYDRRGHRRSSLGDIQQRTVEMHADDAAALIQRAGAHAMPARGQQQRRPDRARRYAALSRAALGRGAFRATALRARPRWRGAVSGRGSSEAPAGYDRPADRARLSTPSSSTSARACGRRSTSSSGMCTGTTRAS